MCHTGPLRMDLRQVETERRLSRGDYNKSSYKLINQIFSYVLLRQLLRQFSILNLHLNQWDDIAQHANMPSSVFWKCPHKLWLASLNLQINTIIHIYTNVMIVIFGDFLVIAHISWCFYSLVGKVVPQITFALEVALNAIIVCVLCSAWQSSRAKILPECITRSSFFQFF